MKYLLLYLFLCVPALASDNEIYVSTYNFMNWERLNHVTYEKRNPLRGYAEFGISLFHPYTMNWDKAKTVEVGISKQFEKFTVRTNIGGWADRCEERRKVSDSLYTSVQIGAETDVVGTYVEYYIGPAVLSNKDQMLGSHFQIAQEIGIGRRDSRGVKIGVAVKHFSNAGLSKNNLGRNFLVIKVEL